MDRTGADFDYAVSTFATAGDNRVVQIPLAPLRIVGVVMFIARRAYTGTTTRLVPPSTVSEVPAS
jgi:hypothetical protein